MPASVGFVVGLSALAEAPGVAAVTPGGTDTVIVVPESAPQAERTAASAIDDLETRWTLDLRDRVHAVILAYETGLVRPGDDSSAPAVRLR